jgi:hypothetical protein
MEGDGRSWDTSGCSVRVQGDGMIVISKTLEQPSNDAATTRQRWILVCRHHTIDVKGEGDNLPS